MIVRFFDLKSEAAKKVGFTVSSSNIIYGEGFYATDSTAIALPLDPTRRNVTFSLVSDTSNHRLVMSYDVEVAIFDPDCDPSFSYINLDTVRQTFDSTVVVGKSTNRQLSTNVKIYF